MKEDPIPGNTNDYVVGTLRYNRYGLITLYFWLLVADFGFSLAGGAFSNLSALTMKNLAMSNTMMSFFMIVLPCALNVIFIPIISTRSDRHRGRFGRRIPFIFWPTPIIAIFLVLFGCSDWIGAWFHGLGIGKLFRIGPYWVIMTVLCATLLLYQFFNLFTSTIYYYLWVDVIPGKFMGRFIALFRMVGQAATFIWGRYILGHADRHIHLLYLGISVLYLVSFLVMCAKVREGEYPPPPPRPARPRMIDSIRGYFRECFHHRIYVATYLASGLYWASWSMSTFVILFARETLKLPLDRFGKITGWCGLMGIPLLYALGYISDKVHPVRMNLLAIVITVAVAFGSFFGIHDERTLLIYSLLNTFSVLCYTISNIPMRSVLYPRDRYGQYNSAEVMIMSTSILIGGGLIGVFLDRMGSYRYIYLWQGILITLALVPQIQVYLEWKRRGGAHYIPPTMETSPGLAAAAPSDP